MDRLLTPLVTTVPHAVVTCQSRLAPILLKVNLSWQPLLVGVTVLAIGYGDDSFVR